MDLQHRRAAPAAGPAGYLNAPQGALFGKPDVVGFGTEAFHVREIARDLANDMVVLNHYSRRFVPSSRIHLGVVLDGSLVGALQFGVAMNPASHASIMAGCGLYEYLELNRMWLDEIAPRNSESRALSFAIKFIRRKEPRIKFIQSFADERCGLSGRVYQAANFLFCGMHIGRFWELDGEFYHNSLMTDTTRMNSPRARTLLANKARAIPHDLKQYRYIYLMQPRYRRDLLLKVKPYPKDFAACPVDEPIPIGPSRAEPPEAAPPSTSE